jgi:hypothetical protein
MKGYKFEKLSKYILYYLCVILLLLGYWGLVKIYYSNFPIFKYSFLDWASALGLYTFVYMKMDNFRRDFLKCLNI